MLDSFVKAHNYIELNTAEFADELDTNTYLRQRVTIGLLGAVVLMYVSLFVLILARVSVTVGATISTAIVVGWIGATGLTDGPLRLFYRRQRRQ